MGLEISTLRQATQTILYLKGRIDSTTSDSLAVSIENVRNGSIIIDFSECDFISSAGLRVLLVSYQNSARRGQSIEILNISPRLFSVFEVTGLDQLLGVKKAPNKVSIEGCELISSGACGDCYRLDDETIVKLYREGIDPSIAEKEKQFAKTALLLGLPTALSYDVVTCGTRSGVVYEMIDARLLSEIIRSDLPNTPKYGRQLAGIAKDIHLIEGDSAVLPRLKDQFVHYIHRMREFIPERDVEFLLDQLNIIPESDKCVHFDLHSNNIMIKDGEPLIIDLGDFSIGHYFFDLGLIYMIYGLPEFGICETVTKIPSAEGARLCDAFLEAYFDDLPRPDRDSFDRNRYFLASLRSLYAAPILPHLRSQMIETLQDHLIPRMRRLS